MVDFINCYCYLRFMNVSDILCIMDKDLSY